MNTFQIKILPDKVQNNSVHFLIDGKDLLDTITEFETSFAESLAGEYGYLTVNEVPIKELLGEDPNEKTTIFGCDCGIRACWPMEVKVEASGDFIVWKNFTQPHRKSWNYSSLGPFKFNKSEYQAELQKILEWRKNAPL